MVCDRSRSSGADGLAACPHPDEHFIKQAFSSLLYLIPKQLRPVEATGRGKISTVQRDPGGVVPSRKGRGSGTINLASGRVIVQVVHHLRLRMEGARESIPSINQILGHVRHDKMLSMQLVNYHTSLDPKQQRQSEFSFFGRSIPGAQTPPSIQTRHRDKGRRKETKQII